MTTLAEQAARLHADFNRDADSIRSHRDLNNDAKRRRMARAYLEHKTAIEALLADDAAKRQQRLRELHRRLFSPPGDAVTYRDALDRAEDVKDPQAALERFRRAEEMGDDELARAFALVGVERAWVDVVNAYMAERPSVETALEEMWELRRAGDLKHTLQAAMTVAPATKPPELADVPDYDLEALAEMNQDPPATMNGERNANAVYGGVA